MNKIIFTLSEGGFDRIEARSDVRFFGSSLSSICSTIPLTLF
jgi:hypothetical protein